MKSLPPELLSSIIDLAAKCSSLYQSYKLRLRALSALTLVNRQFHQIAQPLLPQQLHFRSRNEEDVLSKNCAFQEVQKATDKIGFSTSLSGQSGNFAKLKELRLYGLVPVSLAGLSNYKHLERLSLEQCWLQTTSGDFDFILPSLKELSFEQSTIILEGPNLRSDSFFSTARFPSLRALGIKTLACLTPRRKIVRKVSDIVSPSLLPQLDCMTADEIEPRGTSSLSPPSLPLPVPVLFDLDPRHTANIWARSSLASDPSPSHCHLRIRLPCEPISSNEDIESALEFAHKLIEELTDLEELYLDIYPRDGRRGYVLEKQSEEEIEKLEEIAREKKVEIIWENHEDDWCRSLVSKEFWRRSKAKKEKEEHRREG